MSFGFFVSLNSLHERDFSNNSIFRRKKDGRIHTTLPDYVREDTCTCDITPSSIMWNFQPNCRHNNKLENELVKIHIICRIKGDVVLECIILYDDRKEMMSRTMFNTSFIRSNIQILNREEIDTLWDANDSRRLQSKGMPVAKFVAPFDLSYFKEKDGHPLDAFAKAQEILNTVNWLNQKGDAADNMLHQPAATNFILEILESSPETTDTGMPH